MLFSSPVAEALGTPDQDVHTVAGDEPHGQQTERAHLKAGGAKGNGKREENGFMKNTSRRDLVAQIPFSTQGTFWQTGLQVLFGSSNYSFKYNVK